MLSEFWEIDGEGGGMKILRVRIHRGSFALGQSQMVYPARYNAREVMLNGLGPLDVNRTGAYSGHIGRGGSEEWCIILLDDALADEYALDSEMEIITAAQADALMEQWRIDNSESNEIMLDPDRVLAALAKKGAKVALSAEDKRSLDPDDPMPGINKRLRKVADIVAKSGKKLASV